MPNGIFATFLELDATRTHAVVGYGADGVVLVDVNDPRRPTVDYHLDTSLNGTDNYFYGAFSACVRTNAPTSDIAWLNADSEESLLAYNLTVNVARFSVTAPSQILSQDVIFPSNGKMASCGAYHTTTSKGLIVTSTTTIDLYNSAVSPPQKLRSFATPCFETYYIGQLGQYGLFFHGANSTCNCAPSGPCPLGIQVLGNSPVTTSFTNQFGPYLVDGLHFVSPVMTPQITVLTDSTLEVQLAQDANVSQTAVMRREGCGSLSNTNLVNSACLVYRGTCPMSDKVTNCMARGAKAVVIVGYEGRGLFNPVINPVGIPVFYVSFEVGEAFRLALEAASTGTTSITTVPPTIINPPLPNSNGAATPSSLNTAPSSDMGASSSSSSTPTKVFSSSAHLLLPISPSSAALLFIVVTFYLPSLSTRCQSPFV
jgi:hypothetical protein